MGTDMDLRRIRTFVAVAEQGGVSRAALSLHIAQPALSRQIMALQEELGFQLFERVGRRLSLTGEGEEFLSDCRSLLSHAGSVVERAQSLRRGRSRHSHTWRTRRDSRVAPASVRWRDHGSSARCR